VTIEFHKMHGCGNDFIVFDDLDDRLAWHELSELAERNCRRRFAVGADGLIAIGRPAGRDADFEMRYLNADGSRAEMCGNGIRCVGKYAADVLGWEGDTVRVLTGAGVLPLTLIRGEGQEVVEVTVGMGEPRTTAEAIPTTLRSSGHQVVDCVLEVGDRRLPVTTVSMGNPHAVSFVDSITDELVLGTGPLMETHPVFPKGVNAEFAKVIAAGRIRMRVWERGVGETLACGTGACATVVAAILTGRASHGSEITVMLNGGELTINWPGSGMPVLMTGPAETVYTGILEL
jgi:diaminopimelate epimerase